MSKKDRETTGGDQPDREGADSPPNESSPETSTAGSRSVGIGGSVSGSVIVTGNGNIIHSPPPPPPKPKAPNILIDSLPITDPHLFGRDDELAALDSAWESQKANIVTVVAWGGVGKTALMRKWMIDLCGAADCRGAARVFGWSFYSQGAGEGKQASADRFVDAALRWFGDPEPEAGSPTDKGRRLAAMVQAERTLLILDGLEPVQHPPGPQEGKLKDEALRALLRNLAVRNPGMCLITTRLAVDDLRTHEHSTVSKMELKHLSPEAGAAVLERLGVTGPKGELETASKEFDGHALALNLLGTFLKKLHGGDVKRRDRIRQLANPKDKKGLHARQVMEAYETWLAQSEEGRRQLSILRIMGLFDRPADFGAIREIFKGGPIRGVTEGFQEKGGLLEKLRFWRKPSNGWNPFDEDWEIAVQSLRDHRLLAPEDQERKDALDCHPLVREHFGERLKAEFPEGWKEAHGRLYEYYKALPEKELPDTLEEMEPLFAAVAYGCMAGRHKEALEDVYWTRIKRKNKHYSTAIIGAFSADLMALSYFFETCWNIPSTKLNEEDQARILGWTGFRLRAMGKLRGAVEPMLAALVLRVEIKDWKYAAINASNLSEIYLTLGEIPKAIDFGQQSLEYACLSENSFQKMSKRATHADALHQAGDWDMAEAFFQKSEQLQKEYKPKYSRLYSLRGYRHCDLLLSRGRHLEVAERAEEALRIALNGSRTLLDIALNYLSLGRAYLLQALADKIGDFAPAESHLNAAVEGLRQAGTSHHLPRGLLARAALFRETRQYQRAWDDLTEAHEIAQFGEMRLFLADYHLEAARLCLAQNQREQAADHLSQAEQLIQETGYHRRDGEVEALRGELGD